MTISRRNVLLEGAVIGAGVIASNTTGRKALAAGQLPERRIFQGLAWNDPIVATYRDGVRLLKAANDRVESGGSCSAFMDRTPGLLFLLSWQSVFPAVAQGLDR